MTLGCLAAGCSLADSLITAVANRTCSVGLLRILSASVRELTPLVPGPYVDSTCSEGQVVCRRPNGSIGGVWRGASVRTVHVVHGL